MSNLKERARQWPNMISLIQQADNYHETLKNKINSMNPISEVQTSIDLTFESKFLSHNLAFFDINPQYSFITGKKYKLEKGIYAYQVIWQPKKTEKANDRNYNTRHNEVIYLTKNDNPVSIEAMK